MTMMEPELQRALLDMPLWNATSSGLETLLTPVCTTLTYLEGDDATISSVHACFVSIAVHLESIPTPTWAALQLGADGVHRMRAHVRHRFESMYSHQSMH